MLDAIGALLPPVLDRVLVLPPAMFFHMSVCLCACAWVWVCFLFICVVFGHVFFYSFVWFLDMCLCGVLRAPIFSFLNLEQSSAGSSFLHLPHNVPEMSVELLCTFCEIIWCTNL